MRQAVAKSKRIRDIDPDSLRVTLFDDLAQAIVLFFPIWIPGSLIVLTLTVAVQGQSIDASLLVSTEHEDRAPAGSHCRFRQEAHDHRVFIVLPGEHDPHVKALALHDLGQDRL
jgi:hypothetical protein